MTLNEYIAELQKLIESNPSKGDLTVIYSKDDEGNGYQKVEPGWPGSVGYADLDKYHIDLFFQGEDLVTESEDDEPMKINAICIN